MRKTCTHTVQVKAFKVQVEVGTIQYRPMYARHSLVRSLAHFAALKISERIQARYPNGLIIYDHNWIGRGG